MAKNKFILASLIISYAGFANATTQLPFFDKHDLTPFWSDEKQFAPTTVEAFNVEDQAGRAISIESMRNKITLINFFFADCPQFCPLIMTNIKSFLSKQSTEFKKSIQIYSFSVQPERDTSLRLNQYAKMHRLNQPSWHLLTGRKDVIYKVGRSIFKDDAVTGQAKSADSFQHSSNIYLVDFDLRLRGIYNANDADAMKLLEKDVRNLQKEKTRL